MDSGSSVSSTSASTVASTEVGEVSDDDLETSDRQLVLEGEAGDDGNATCRRPCDLGADSPIQPEMLLPSTYPLTAFGSKMGRFNPA